MYYFSHTCMLVSLTESVHDMCMCVYVCVCVCRKLMTNKSLTS